MDEQKGVQQTIEDSNSRFYKAFERLSIEKMDAAWKHSDDTICIHPGWEMFTSWTAIRESWVRIFENTKMIKFFISNIKIKAFENIAIVVCLENIDSVIEDENENGIRMGRYQTRVAKFFNFSRIPGKTVEQKARNFA